MCNFQASITPWKNNSKAALTLSFDGGYIRTNNLVKGILTTYKMPATWFIVTGCIGGSLQGRAVISWTELKYMLTQGMEIASHSVTHPKLVLSFGWHILKYICSSIRKPWKVLAPNAPTKARRAVSSIYKDCRGVNYREMLSEAAESKTVIEAHVGQRSVSFAYPGGRYNSALKRGIKDAGYLSARSTDDGYNFLDSIDFYALKSKVWNVNVHAHEANGWVDAAVEKGAWLIETYHVVSRDGDTGYYYDTAISDFDAHLAYAALKNIWVDTQENIVKYIKERNATKVKPQEISTRKIVLLVENDLNSNTYEQALTLKTTVPNTCSKVKITQAGNAQNVLSIKENSQRCVYFNILPNRGEVIVAPF